MSRLLTDLRRFSVSDATEHQEQDKTYHHTRAEKRGFDRLFSPHNGKKGREHTQDLEVPVPRHPIDNPQDHGGDDAH
jgi:hypothetical protein